MSLCYTLNQNFESYYRENNTDICTIAPSGGLFYSVDPILDNTDFFDEQGYCALDPTLKDNEVFLYKGDAEQICLASQTDNLIGKDLYEIKSDGNKLGRQIIETYKEKVAGYRNDGFFGGIETIRRLNAMQLFCFGYLVCQNNPRADAIIKSALNNDFVLLDARVESCLFVEKTIPLFNDLFTIIEILGAVVLFCLYALFSINNVRQRKYQIGVFKSLGIKSKDMNYIFLIKNLILGFGSLILSSILSYPFFTLANKLINIAYSQFFILGNVFLNIFYFHFDIFLLTYFLLITLFILFTFIPLHLIKRVSPAKIVNNKSE